MKGSYYLPACLYLAAASAGVHAQTVEQSGAAALEEVIVTANRREQNLQDVALSVSAFTAEFFRESGTQTLKQLEQYTPSLKIAAVQDSRSTSIRIRGIGSIGTNAGIDPSVGLFIDGVYQGRAGMSITDFMDIERVEVLRGPQGTLYGKNTAAGALNIISRLPTEQFEAELEGVVGNYDAVEFRGFVNTPLGSGGSATRLSGYSVDRDGFDDNEYLNDDVNNADRWGIKSRTLMAGDNLGDLLLTLDYAEENSDCCAPDVIDYIGGGSALGLPFDLIAATTGEPLPEADPKDRNVYFNQPWTNEVKVGGVAAEWNLELASEYSLTWLNAWRHYENTSIYDGDFSHYEAVSGSTEVEMDQYSSEFRITSPEWETWDYVAGLYFFYSDMDTEGETGMLELLGPLFGFGFIFPDGSVNYDTNKHETTSAAVFGQANWNFADSWRLTLGGRGTWEEKKRSGSQVTVPETVFDAPPIAGPTLELDDQRDASDFSATAAITHFLRDDLMVYASFAQGFKSGGFNQVRTAVGLSGEFDDERSRNYEMGWKGSWLDRQLQVNGTIFYIDYDDFQAQGFDGTNITVRNAGSLESKGVELEVVYVPTTSLTLGTAVGYNDAEYQDFETGECTAAQVFAITGGSPFIAPDCVQDLSGEDLDNAPEWTVSSFLQYDGDIAGTRMGWFTRIEHNYTDDYYMAQDLDENLKNDDAHVVNLRMGLRAADRKWELTAWSRNLLDEEYYTIGFDIPVLSGYAAINAPPRTYGLTFNYRID